MPGCMAGAFFVSLYTDAVFYGGTKNGKDDILYAVDVRGWRLRVARTRVFCSGEHAKAEAQAENPGESDRKDMLPGLYWPTAVFWHMLRTGGSKAGRESPGPHEQGADVCAKGLAGIQALYHPNRNKYPLRRVGARGSNRWKRITWDEALTEIAHKLMDTREKYGR